MPEFPGTLKPPRLATPPGSPVKGQMYFNTGDNKLYWWDGTAWVVAGGGVAAAEVNISTGGPSPRVGELLWMDTDESLPAVPTTFTRVTSLPSSPYDGQEINYVADAANGVIWRLRYYAAGGTYKWEFIGGSSLFSETVTSESTNSTTFVNLATVGPQVTLPLVGDYDIELGARVFQASGGNQIALMSYSIGATAAVDTDAADVSPYLSGQINTGSRYRRKTGLGAVALVTKYRNATSANVIYFERRWMRVQPVRVG